MKAHALLRLHQRQCVIMEMVIDCDKHLARNEPNLKRYEYSNDYYIGIYPRQKLIEYCLRNISKYTAIKERLISYYKDVQIRIMSLQPEIELNTTSEMDLATKLS